MYYLPVVIDKFKTFAYDRSDKRLLTNQIQREVLSKRMTTELIFSFGSDFLEQGNSLFFYPLPRTSLLYHIFSLCSLSAPDMSF